MLTLPPSRLILDDCETELDLAASQLLRRGHCVDIEPRAFNLLAYLVQHRDRVVPKQELLQNIWQARGASDSALTRAVMKARVALGDEEQQLIRTVPRVGYRFTGNVADAPARLPFLRDGDPVTIGVLPFENQTGDDSLQWIELGLSALLSHALDHDARLSPVDVHTMRTATETSRDSSPDWQAAVHQNIGARYLVDAVLWRVGGRFELRGRLIGGKREQPLLAQADEPWALVCLLVAQLRRALFPASAETEPPLPAPLRHPQAIEAFARGLEAEVQQRFSQAAELFGEALRLEPGAITLKLALLRARADLADAEAAHKLARSLLSHAELNGALLLSARVSLALARLNYHQRRLAAARFRLSAAIKIGESQLTLDEQGMALIKLAQISLAERDFDSALHHAELLAEHAQRSGNRLQALKTLEIRAVVAGCRGNAQASARLSAEAAEAARAMHCQVWLLSNCVNAAYALLEQALIDEALRFAEEALEVTRESGNWAHAGYVFRVLCMIHRVRRSPGTCRAQLAALPSPEHLPGMARFIALSAHAHVAASSGDHAAAAIGFTAAMQAFRENRYALQEHETLPWFIAALVQSGQRDAARAELERASSHPGYLADERGLGHLLHCRALLAHASGDIEQALELLQTLASRKPAPLWHLSACADAAWLCAERGDAEAAHAWLQALDERALATPLGLATLARVQFAAQGVAAALPWHERYLAAIDLGDAPDFFSSLGPWYRAQQADAPPRAPFLPSRL